MGRVLQQAEGGILGISSGVGGIGVVGNASGASGGMGVLGVCTSTTGMGGIFRGQGVATTTSLAGGSGSVSNGTSLGVYGYATGTGNDVWGGIFQTATATTQTRVGGRTGGTVYKINGTGTVATMVKDTKNEYVNMFCPESPEILFQDYGTGKLENGKAYINIDPILAKNIFIDDAHPMKVFIQLEGDCKGVFVTNKTKNGFEVKELQGGKSNVSFSWSLTANRINTYLDNGGVDSRNQDVRFPKSPAFKQTKTEQQSYKENKTSEGK